MKLEIPHVPPSLNKVLRMHWSAKRDLRDNWTLLVRSQLDGAYLKPMVKMRVTITLWHSRIYDKDNAFGACKVVVDALKHNKLIFDDSQEYLELHVEQVKCPHKERKTVIDLEAI
jgi:Holliday junction resolvase RusA-like endonuclease